MLLLTSIILLAAILIVIFVIIALIIFMFNEFIRMKNDIIKAWSNIDVLLKQRYDEFPRLVEVCKGYMKHENEIFSRIAILRTQWFNAKTIKEKAGINDEFTETIKSLFAIAENYPNLKANENFLALQRRISGLENEIADRREFYNDSVTIYNARIEQIPWMFISKQMKLQPAELFKVTEEEKRRTEFSGEF